jgi:hypothetical protein
MTAEWAADKKYKAGAKLSDSMHIRPAERPVRNAGRDGRRYAEGGQEALLPRIALGD